MSTDIDVDNQLVKYGDPLFLVIPSEDNRLRWNVITLVKKNGLE